MPLLVLLVLAIIIGSYLYFRSKNKFTRGGDINQQGEDINKQPGDNNNSPDND